jgi:hypothetical protein
MFSTMRKFPISFIPKHKYSTFIHNILGVNDKFTKKELKKMYREKCLENHPDQGGNITKFLEIREAYTILNDDFRKKEISSYDAVEQKNFENAWIKRHTPPSKSNFIAKYIKNIYKKMTANNSLQIAKPNVIDTVYFVIDGSYSMKEINILDPKLRHVTFYKNYQGHGKSSVIDYSGYFCYYDNENSQIVEERKKINLCINSIFKMVGSLQKYDTINKVWMQRFGENSHMMYSNIDIKDFDYTTSKKSEMYMCEGDYTKIYDAINFSIDTINNSEFQSLGNTLFIVFTDGQDGDSKITCCELAKKIALNGKISIIFVTIYCNDSKLMPIVRAAKNGKIYNVEDNFDDVMSELTNDLLLLEASMAIRL